MRLYLHFWFEMVKSALSGSVRYYLWLGFLLSLIGIGAFFYSDQMQNGLAVTNMSQQVSWGVYIANFTYLVGVAAAAVLLVVPSYLYHNEEVKEVVLLGELLAFSAIIMCLLFVTVDLGRPDRFMHILPKIGKLNFPHSILAWDVIVLNGYLFLNFYIPGYLLFRQYCGMKPKSAHYLPFVFLSIAWAVSIHTVTAFLYSGLGGRPYWNSAILAPRFLVSAFAGGPAILILLFDAISRNTDLKVKPGAYATMKRVMSYTVLMNLFLFACEIFKEFYTDSQHVISAQYMLFGLYGKGMIVPFVWSAVIMEVCAALVLLIERLRENWLLMRIACVFTIVGIWVEKGMGLIVPGFIHTPLGDLVEYTPSLHEFFICVAVWSVGALVYTTLAKVAVEIQVGKLRLNKNERSPISPA